MPAQPPQRNPRYVKGYLVRVTPEFDEQLRAAADQYLSTPTKILRAAAETGLPHLIDRFRCDRDSMAK